MSVMDFFPELPDLASDDVPDKDIRADRIENHAECFHPGIPEPQLRISPFDLRLTRPICPAEKPQRQFYRFLCKFGTSLSCLTSSEWAALASRLSTPYVQPSRKMLRKELVGYAEYIRAKLIYSLRSKRFSILTDGGKWAGRHFYFVVAFTPAQLELVDVLHLEVSDSKSISTSIGQIIREFIQTKRTPNVVSICSDNAQNLVRAFNLNEPTDSILGVTGYRICHLRCAVHTVNLALVDLAGEGGQNDYVRMTFCKFKTDMMAIMVFLGGKDGKADLRRHNVTEKVPKIQQIKWNTWGRASQFIVRHRGVVLAIIAASRNLTWCAAYFQIAAFLNHLQIFVESTEGDHIVQSQVFTNYTRLIENLSAMTDNQFALRFKSHVEARFVNTGDIKVAELAYIFTVEGFAWMRQRREIFSASTANSANEQAKIDMVKRNLIEEIRLLGGKLGEIAESTGEYKQGVRRYMPFWLDVYLESDGPSPDRLLSQWWDEFSMEKAGQQRPAGIIDEEKIRARYFFAQTALRLTEMPATEAVCERIISVMNQILPSNRYRCHDDLVRAELMIHMYYQFHPDEDAPDEKP
jgi:hypothetical protein